MLSGLAFFCQILGCVLARDCVYAILGFFFGSKEGFCEVKCGLFKGFGLGKERMEE